MPTKTDALSATGQICLAENAPHLADQREDYLLKTLREYISGARHGYDATLVEVLQPVSDAPIVELTCFLVHARLV